MMQVTVPRGMSAGQQMIVQAPDGVRMQVTLPPGLQEGQHFRVALPSAPAAQAAENSANSAASLRVGVQAAMRQSNANAKAAREKLEEANADREAAQKRQLEEAERKATMRREAEVFKREMEEIGSSSAPVATLGSAFATVDAALLEMPPAALPSVPSPIGSVPGSLLRLEPGLMQAIQPLLNDISELMTYNKINRALADWAGKPRNSGKLSEAQASAILDSIDNQLRWPQAVETLKRALSPEAGLWAANITDSKCLDYDSQPKHW